MVFKNGNVFVAFAIVYIYLLIILIFLPAIELMILKVLLLLLVASPLGEMLIRYMYGARKIITRQEKEYLAPLFMNVYRNVYETKKGTSRRIKLYIDRSMAVNAYAIGSNTIVVTRGAVNNLSPQELQGVIAHEFGHLYNGDSLMMLTLLGGNLYIGIVMLVIRLIKVILGACDIITGEDAVYSSIGKFILWLVSLVAVPAVLFIRLFLQLKQRHNEYMADRFADEVGHGANLISALYKLDKLDFGDGRVSFLERILHSHPEMDKRIARLENLGN